MSTGRFMTPKNESTRRTADWVLFNGNPNQIDTISFLLLIVSLSSNFLSLYRFYILISKIQYSKT